MEKKQNYILFLLLGLIFICGYLLCLGSYPLLEPDESRYVDMARDMFQTKDFLTLYLNGDFFFEKPPLFFWLEYLSCKVFGGVNEFCARLPIVLLSFLPLGLLFTLCKKVKDIKFAFIASVVLLTSLEYILITKIAILDSVLTSFAVSSCLCYFFTHFVQDKNKKYFWALTYIFSGLAVLAKGIPGAVIPFGTILVSTILFKTYKETFKYSFIGILLFLGITLPWHILMLKMYPKLFFEEYIYKHHILRFLGSDVIHRTEPWYFYLLTLLWGLFPHIFVLLPKLFNTIKTKIQTRDFGFSNDKFLTLNIIASLVILIFFSSSGAKLITYILPIYPFLAVIIADIWASYIEKDNKILKYTLLTINSILVLASFIFPFVAAYLLNGNTGNLHPMQVSLAIASYYLIKSIIENERFKSLIWQCVFMALLLGFASPLGYKIDYSFGQNDLMNYAKMAKENNYTISTYKTGSKYCLLYYSGLKHIDFQIDDNLDWLNNELNKKNNLLIIRNKDIEELPVKIKTEGKKYSVVERG